MDKYNKIIKKQLELIKTTKEEYEKIRGISDNFIKALKEKLKKNKIKADVFLGGSLAKGTIVKKDIYDIDIFVRFDKSYNKANKNNEISNLLGKLLGKAKKVHGSRDYYQIKTKNILIEVIPVLKIEKPKQSVNVTDLSYFHVNYIVKKIKKNPKLINEIVLAKTFAYAQNCYGAESYMQGFSGYSLELLICHYKAFLNFVKEMSKINIKEKLIIDDKKLYKNNVLTEMNNSKTHSPIILVDPTFKERNALSSLSKETFIKFQKSCKDFLRKPSKKFFIRKSVIENFKQKPIIISIKTNKQSGDIAGTKSKKFFKFFFSRLKKEFEIKKSAFEYNDKKNLANFYLVLNKKKPSLIRGPPITSITNLNNFKKIHKNAFINNGFAYAKLKHNLTFNKWFKRFLKKDKKIIREMGVREVKKVNLN